MTKGGSYPKDVLRQISLDHAIRVSLVGATGDEVVALAEKFLRFLQDAADEVKS